MEHEWVRFKRRRRLRDDSLAEVGQEVRVPSNWARYYERDGSAERIASPDQALPEGFPGRTQLLAAGVETFDQVQELEARVELLQVPGIGKVTAERIQDALSDRAASRGAPDSRGGPEDDPVTEDDVEPAEAEA